MCHFASKENDLCQFIIINDYYTLIKIPFIFTFRNDIFCVYTVAFIEKV